MYKNYSKDWFRQRASMDVKPWDFHEEKGRHGLREFSHRVSRAKAIRTVGAEGATLYA
jgi:hypothetical protein